VVYIEAPKTFAFAAIPVTPKLFSTPAISPKTALP
jgi:hypothetical protein